jgi:hypothetical protein
MDGKFEVWFSGTLQPNASLSGAVDALLRLYPKMERARAERLLSGGRKLLKSNVEEQTAERLLQRLVGAGLGSGAGSGLAITHA